MDALHDFGGSMPMKAAVVTWFRGSSAGTMLIAVRVFGAAGVVAAVWALGVGTTGGRVGVSLALGINVVVALAAFRDRQHDRLVPLDVVTLAAIVIALPTLHVAGMVGLLILTTRIAVEFGLLPGVGSGAVTIGIVLASNALAPGDRALDVPTLLAVAAAALSLPIVAAQTTATGRRFQQRTRTLDRMISDVDALPDLESTAGRLAELCASETGADVVTITMADTGEPRLIAYPRPAPDVIVGALSRSSVGPTARCLDDGQSVVVDDLRDHPALNGAVPASDRAILGSCIAVPVVAGQYVIGAITAYFPRGTRCSATCRSLLQDLARRSAPLLLRSLSLERVTRARETLEENEREHAAFIAAITHDLRSPLTTIRGFIETLLLHSARLDTEATEQALSIALRNADDLQRQISQLLEFSKLGATDELAVLPAPIDLAPVLEDIIQACAGSLRRHELVVDAPPGLDAVVDLSALEHILVNLLTNAAKYSPAGTTIAITARPRGEEEVVISVRDEGRGIRDSERSQVFERFWRSPSATGTKGTGIGLSIVRRYVELSGGHIWVEPAPQQGSIFSFTLPRTSARSDADGSVPRRIASDQ